MEVKSPSNAMNVLFPSYCHGDLGFSQENTWFLVECKGPYNYSILRPMLLNKTSRNLDPSTSITFYFVK